MSFSTFSAKSQTMSATRQIALLVFPRVQLLDVAGPSDVFHEAARQLGQPRAYRIQLISNQTATVRTSSGVRLQTDTTVQKHRGTPDTLLVAGGPQLPDTRFDAATLAWLHRQALAVRRLGSVCSGAFVLAAAGLLNGRRVTTHWNVAQELAQRYPELRVDADRIYLRDGNVYTSAGVTAGMDLALAMVEEDHGRELALRVARELVMFLKRPGGQSQFSAHLAAQGAERSAIRGIQEHVLANLPQDLSVPALAAHSGMSERNFARIFRAEADMTPAEFVEFARIEQARRMLEASEVPLKRLADQCGYTSVDSLRRAFARRLGLTPGEYRRRFA